MVLLVSITLLVLLLYSIIVFLLWLGLGRLRTGSSVISDGPGSVSVIIPYKDEEKRLMALFNDLSAQDYPEELVEFIFVNDHSRDGSSILLDELIGTDTRFLCLELPGERTGKKEAISFAVQHAKSDWFIQTDADCRIGPQFIALHMAFREEHQSDLVAGLVTTQNGKGGFLQLFERLDLLSLVGTGAGSFHFKRPVMCNGANLAYSRELYMETRQFDPSKGVASGDDIFLMIGARKLGKTLSFLVDKEAIAETYPIGSIAGFITQRMRWGSKVVLYNMIDIQLLAVLVALTNMLVLFIPFLIFLIPGYWAWITSAFYLKTLADFALLYRISSYTGQKQSLWLFLPISLAYYLLQFVILLGSLTLRKSWKRRRM